ncbi:MAG TPA: TIGR03621 family F420-dependent LLM class oxidoreductase [Pseudomonadales bacterium]|jgi:probable F420-dependent oxidoreductase|nr:TIGR03621 family F420-dependent LLM class oxidoreductase [Pseudomonadales bacterium]
MAVRPFRFGIQLSSLPVDDWAESARRIEALGYSSLVVPDHFSASLWDPTTMLGGVAAVTRTLRVGALVYGIDYRHPVIYARQAATLQAMSGGRHEFGIGAGWMIDDYRWAGMQYDRPSVRIERLEEALTIIASMWSKKKTTFVGKHYRVNEAPLKIEMPEPPKILIGGGGEKLLAVAGRHADIVGINPKIPEGRITAATALDITPESIRQKIGWMRAAAEAAGRDPDAIELNALVFMTAITDDPAPVREMVGANTGMTAAQVAACPLFLIGSAAEIRDSLERRREQTGINYVVIQGQERAQVERFAQEIVSRLAGK